ncbi:S8 family peptidase [Enterocloster lavalensis]|uniref:S8 family peptidase n=1 Tax=Enterocloster lavalensis TaxID=460384 RepID=UPI000D1A2EA0|nr:S8 family peptidase [Enterocloster lavalensis]PST31130.1 peptidase [Enterocloster lavalensis]
MALCPFNPASEDYADFIYNYSSQNVLSPTGPLLSGACTEFVTQNYAIFYVPLNSILPLSLEKYAYYSIPNLFTPLDTSSMDASGILSTFNTPALANKGAGTMIGFLDTGIDYTNRLFCKPNGTTRILGIWDQTLPVDTDELPPGVPDYFRMSGASYGTEFTEEQINEALASDDPLSLVPSRDTNGHGTFIAGIAAGGSLPDDSFTGAAPECSLVVVKLKQAKRYLRDYYLIPEDATAFQENDIMMGIKYLRVMAHRYRMPLVILIALGSNMGSHEGLSPLSTSIQDVTRFLGFSAVIAAGNETGLSHHFEGIIPSDEPYQDVEIRVGEEESRRGFVLELWATNSDTYSVGFVSPTGEAISRIPIISGNETRIPFLLEGTVITVNYQLIEALTGRQLIFMRFEEPTVGIWRIRVYNSQFFTGSYHMWLPVEGFISDQTVFLNPSPNNTITLPGNSPSPLTIGAYNHLNNSIYIHSSRGYTLSNVIKPDLAAPGVDVYGPALTGPPDTVPMTRRTGTSVAAAHAAGAVANLMSWGFVEGNDRSMSEAAIRSYLVRGAKRNPALSYPNREWGYGALDLFQTFLHLRE